LEERDWASKLAFLVIFGVGAVISHATLAQWGVAKHLTDFGVARAAAGFDAVRA